MDTPTHFSFGRYFYLKQEKLFWRRLGISIFSTSYSQCGSSTPNLALEAILFAELMIYLIFYTYLATIHRSATDHYRTC